MFRKITNNLKKLHIGQKGMTGLETAIILIAFVTVASVLAYSVLSAGIFSAEKGKSTVYSGLEQAQATMELRGPAVATTDGNSVEYIEFLVGLAIPGEKVDMTALTLTAFNKDTSVDLANEAWDDDTINADKWQYELAPGFTGDADVLQGGNLMLVKVDTSSLAPDAYSWFTVQILPPKGAAITIHRVLPGSLETKMDLK